MNNFTTNVYKMKREILTISKKFTRGLKRPQKKFTAEMMYGILSSQSCKLTDVADTLHEKSKKKNIVERLSLHLANDPTTELERNYLRFVCRWFPRSDNEYPIVHLDDSDIEKENGNKFESLGIVRDGSSKDKKLVKGYHLTEAVFLTQNNQPVSLYSHVHSSHEKEFISANVETQKAISRVVSTVGKATFVLDRGYDHNDIFKTLSKKKQRYIIRLTAKRKVLFHGIWMPVTQLCNRRKGKIKISVKYKGKESVAYISHVSVQITAKRETINLVLVYGLGDTPMMLATNQPINNKDDVIRVARSYFSRWRIEEYFRAKKQGFNFEDFRVRSLAAINHLNVILSLCIAFLAHISLKHDCNSIKTNILIAANPLKLNVDFLYYRILKGISDILAYAHVGVRPWYKTLRPKIIQLSLFSLL